MELKIDGYFECEFTKADPIEDWDTGEFVEEDEEQEIIEKLQSGEYLLGLPSRTVTSLDNLGKPLYYFIMDPTDALEYEFE